ncbi:MAG: GNAT family N-acetyltransferase [Anaerolineaceae bacterium]|nr:GNAT family N-acetyltransferase [Anaerolineaceae bacterium]
MVGLDGLNWSARNAWVGIGIGDPEYWGKGFGSDAMRIILRFAFLELNLWRVNLNVFEYNERAQKSYLKVGFREEGRLRQWMRRDGRRWDLIYMGVLRSDWEALNQS